MGKRSHDAIAASEKRSSRRSSGSDIDNNHTTKSVVTEYTGPSESLAMQCSLPPHAASLDFPSLETFEIHYAKEHTNRCVSCGKNFPSAHFLALHLDELHNPVREALAAKGEKTYSCFVEDCAKKCSNLTKRRLHLIDKHGFPTVYNFRVVRDGIDQSTSLLREGRRRRVSTTSDPSPRHLRRVSRTEKPQPESEITAQKATHANNENVDDGSVQPQSMSNDSYKTANIHGPDDDHMDQLETSLSALSFVPRTVRARQIIRKGE